MLRLVYIRHPSGSSNGRYAAEVLTDGFDTQPAADASWTLPGVVSRKKQFIPALMTAYQEL